MSEVSLSSPHKYQSIAFAQRTFLRDRIIRAAVEHFAVIPVEPTAMNHVLKAVDFICEEMKAVDCICGGETARGAHAPSPRAWPSPVPAAPPVGMRRPRASLLASRERGSAGVSGGEGD